ncbi:MAG TPA: type I polyketide synthase, partial [Polyangiaceae bacterium]|nr:type I polyketide synthase [Polyangiaceae bacterium]
MSKNREKAFADHFNRGKEPIAIIGIGCRFPGNCDTPKAYWKLLLGKTDAVTEIPRERWDVDAYYDPDFSSSGKISVRRGGFVQGVDLFDAGFFGISPMEAQRMDPQHRMLLEVTYEAIEDAGLALERLAGSRTGVFVGISAHDYGDIQNTPSERVNIGAHTNTGTAQSIASNRISYSFDLRGPSFSVDTACSSSLVAIHLACRSLWTGESELAVAGGVNSIIKPEPEIGFSKGGFLAPDGRCKSFDSRANGYIRSEGTGVILLKPLSRALADGDPIYALIRASVINEDGATNGIAVPSPEAQEAMLLEAYHGSGIDPHLVQFVEAHGTGTPVGDPIEAKAIGRVLGAGRNDYCYLGSVKSNLGHLEPASGIAGITKLALAMKHRLIPPNIHFEKPNPDIPFEELRLKVPTEAVPWPETPRGMFAGVNSFGFGGANAHVILQGAPDERATRSALSRPEGAELIALSARSRGALKALARDYLTWLDGEGRSVSLRDIAYSSVLRRSHHTNRLALAVKDHDSLKALLAAYLAGEARDGLAERKALTQHADIAFVFSGQGPQWFAMGSQLMRLSPVYRGWVEEIDRLFSRHADWSLLAELSRDEATSRISETQIAQPAIFALQVAAAELWKSWGVVPRAVVGHSIGEVAAAFEAGALDLEQAVRVIFHRSRVQAKATGKGKMLAVGLELAEARARVAEYAGRIDVAAVNGPKAITLAGDSDALEALARSLDEDDVFHR